LTAPEATVFPPVPLFLMPSASLSADFIISLLAEHELLEASDLVHADSDLFALGLDSLAMMQLLLHIERDCQVTIPVAEITRERFSTPKRLAEWLSRS
jgi:acyl carrier protein